MDVSEQTTDEEIIQILWDAMDVRELVMSIEASGFFPHEFLIVEADTLVVLEGNRRLAAVRLLLEPELLEEQSSQIPQLTPSAKKALEEVPSHFRNAQKRMAILGIQACEWSGQVEQLCKIPLHCHRSP